MGPISITPHGKFVAPFLECELEEKLGIRKLAKPHPDNPKMYGKIQ